MSFRFVSLLAGLSLAASGATLHYTPLSGPVRLPASPAKVYLPAIYNPGGCPAATGNTYQSGPVYQHDTDNPVRPAWNHADKNLALRGYAVNPGGFKGFTIYSAAVDVPPQLATLFSPNRVPAFTGAYQVYNWNWGAPPNPGTRGTLVTDWGGVTVLGLQTVLGEGLHAPSSGYDLGAGVGAIVLFADADSVTLAYTRNDSGATGYVVHVDNICTDPNLLALYQSLDGGARYVYYGAPDNITDYNLPTLPAGQVFGTAPETEVRVAIVDSGAFMDPRSCNDWWQVRPGKSCP